MDNIARLPGQNSPSPVCFQTNGFGGDKCSGGGEKEAEREAWGVRSGHSHEIVTQIVSYLQSHPANYCEQMDAGIQGRY